MPTYTYAFLYTRTLYSIYIVKGRNVLDIIYVRGTIGYSG